MIVAVEEAQVICTSSSKYNWSQVTIKADASEKF